MEKILHRYDSLAGKFFLVADIVNVLFFLVTLCVWIYFIFQTNFATFEPADLWKAFNGLYNQFAFKVTCIVFILYNGLLGLKGAFDQAFFTFVSLHRWRTVGAMAKKSLKK
ncbi:hypothetical protein COW46_03440 [Candidatus Gracilibacteria bacterium CG17_big_fil_post_rev_8_21_14_2_50_48_13]|nr:MAG: hypothetical protein COW46_03440 [Candidatus Gracilibacteria bacterium CG17_big_fil_post_rev_8_21_14_2_50_48_13]